MWISRKKWDEIREIALQANENSRRVAESYKMLQVKVAGLESILDRLEREGNERVGYDRLIR